MCSDVGFIAGTDDVAESCWQSRRARVFPADIGSGHEGRKFEARMRRVSLCEWVDKASPSDVTLRAAASRRETLFGCVA